MKEIEKLMEKLGTESLYKNKATLEIMDLCMDAALALEQLQAENDRLKRERDEAVKDLNAIIGDIEEIRRRKYCRGRNEHGTVD